MMYFLDFWNDVGGAIVEAFRSLMLTLCEVIYKLIVFFFDIFIVIGNAEILTNETIMTIYERIGLILGLFMIFRVTFSLIQYVINPELLSDKKQGLFNIVQRVILVIVLLGITPSLFRMSYDLQKKIIASNIIPKVIMGKTVTSEESDISEGERLAWYAFDTFYSWNEDVINNLGDNKSQLQDFYDYCFELQGDNNSVIQNNFFKNNGSLGYAFNCVNTKYTYVNIENGISQTYFVIDFDGNGIIPFATGIIILWMIIMYCIQVGIRVVQLAYLQLVAPIPIIMYLDPKGDETLNKWFKQCVTTYIDFFMRVAIIYFVLFIIDVLISNNYSIFTDSLGDVSGWDMSFIIIIMILALLIFAQKLPKLLKELFPITGNAASFGFDLSPKKVFNDTLAARAIGAVGGALGAGASNAVHGYMNMRKAFKNNGGWKSGKAWGAAVGAGLKGTASIAGGVLGGAKAGLKTQDITKVGDAVKTANKNRTERELDEQAGYHWYNPLPKVRDKVLGFAGEPGIDERIKERKQAIIDEKKRESDLARGEMLYNSYSKVKSDGSRSLDEQKAFKHEKYRESYLELKSAKGAVSAAEERLVDAQAELNAARISGDATRIASAQSNYKKALSNSKAAQGKLELAKAKHDGNKKIYADDAEVENLYKFYSDTHSGESELVESQQENGAGDNVSPAETPTENETDRGVDDDNASSPETPEKPEVKPFVSPEQQLESLIEKYYEAQNVGDQDVMDELGTMIKEKQSEINKINIDIEDADELFRDNWMSQGKSDDSDKW